MPKGFGHFGHPLGTRFKTRVPRPLEMLGDGRGTYEEEDGTLQLHRYYDQNILSSIFFLDIGVK
jgi:hypothetical protein